MLATSAALFFAACGDDHDYEYRYPHGDHCSSYATCGTCTPVSGCGWCTYEDGSGSCASEPDHCRGSTFRWNWEPESCSTPVDAGPFPDTTVPGKDTTESGDTTPTTDAPSSDAVTDAATETSESGGDATSTDAAPTTCTAPSRATVACVQTTGGTLCASGQYTLSCHAEAETGTPIPDASLGCKMATTTSGGTFYCCPCPTP